VQYIQLVVNKLNEAQHRFCDEMGGFFATYGLAHSLGVVFGYLLLRAEPATLDEIAADLGISKSGASTSARTLTAFLMLRRVTERGTRRIRYEPIPSMEGMLSTSLGQLQVFLRTLEDGQRVAPPGLPAARLGQLSTGIRYYLEAVEQALQRVKEVPRP
jgi:predicted transcriptional regulator